MDGVKDGIVSYNNLLYYSIITTVENGEQENTVWFYKKFFRCFFLACSFLFSISRIFGILTSINNWTTPLHHCRQMANNQLFSSSPHLLFEKKKRQNLLPLLFVNIENYIVYIIIKTILQLCYTDSHILLLLLIFILYIFLLAIISL